MTDYIKESFKISLSGVIKHAIFKWWIILIAAVVFASLAVGYKYYTVVPETIASNSAEEYSYDALLDSYNAGQTNISVEIENLYDKAQIMNEYTQDSIYYNLDPTSFAVSIATYQLSSSSGSEIEQVYESYLYDISNGEYICDLANELSIEEEYLRETIRVSGFDSSVLNIDSNNTTSSLVIAVYGEDYEYTNKVLDYVVEEIPVITDEISSILPHQCVLLTRNQAMKIETTIRSDQSGVDSYITDLYGKINNLSNNQKSIPEPDNSTNGESGSVSGKTVIKYGAVGGVLGAIIAIGIIVLAYIIDGRVTDNTRFLNRYNVALLGKSDAMIIANIKNYLSNSSDVIFTGTASESIIKDKIEIYKKEIDGIVLIEAPDILENAESRSKLVNSNNVILVEEIKKSKYVDIDEELSVLSSMGKTVVGVILV